MFSVEKQNAVTAEQVRRLFRYDPTTGEFYRVVRSRLGKRSDFFDKKGYRGLYVGKVKFAAHRVAWLHFYGEWPKGQIDHFDMDKGNNAIANLRVVTNTENQQNRLKATSKNSSGLLGAGRNYDKFGAQIRVNGKRVWLGLFGTAAEAHEAYMEAKQRLHLSTALT